MAGICSSSELIDDESVEASEVSLSSEQGMEHEGEKKRLVLILKALLEVTLQGQGTFPSDSLKMPVELSLLPARCLFDQPVQVTVSGLKPQQEVVLRASTTDHRGVFFRSWAEYRADHSGQVDVSRDPSLRGSYTGVWPMGLLCTMKPQIPYIMFKAQTLVPLKVKLSVFSGDTLLAEQINHRCIMGDGVQRQIVSETGFTAVLFTPPGPGPFPAVLDICTFAEEERACLLANKGFVVLMMPVYGHKADRTTELHLDQYEEAVGFLLKLPKVGSAQVGVVARSKAADVALSLAAFVSGIGAVVWINGCCSNVETPLYHQQKQLLPALKPDTSKSIKVDSDTFIIKHNLPIPHSEGQLQTVVPIERASAQFLFVASEDDQNWDSVGFMEQIVQRLQHHGKNNYKAVSFPGAGHFLKPPFSPLVETGFHFILQLVVLWGGEAAAHAAAELQLWTEIQDFLIANIQCKTNYVKAKL